MTRINRERLDNIYEAYSVDPAFDHLRIGKNPLVEGEGGSPIALIVGEAPGAMEVRKKRPFVGPAGMVLRQLMAHVGLYSSEPIDPPNGDWDGVFVNCWLTNAVKYRPSPHKNPTDQEIEESRRYLYYEWQAVGKPDIIVTVGGAALKAVSRRTSVMARAGRMWTTYNSERDPQTITFWPMLHPSFGLRNENVRDTIENHWIRFGEWLQNHPRFQ